jgi:hypothetical protein
MIYFFVIYSHLIYFIKDFHKCGTFSSICSDTTAINGTTVQHKIGSFASNLAGHKLG